MIKLISQSFIHDLESYMKDELCGNILRHKYVDGQLTSPTGVMKLGHYFEYHATGALPKDGQRPEPEMKKNGTRVWSVDELTGYLKFDKMPGRLKTPPVGVPLFRDFHGMDKQPDIPVLYAMHKEEALIQSMESHYVRAYKQAQNFKELCDRMGIEILEVQEHGARQEMEGTRDIKAKWKGKIITIDLKYSGLLLDEWNKFGWGALAKGNSDHKGYQIQKDFHQVQALQYEYVFGNPFYFWVFSSATGAENTGANRLFKFGAGGSFEQEQHINRGVDAMEKFQAIRKAGFDAMPEYNTCSSCELLETCKEAARTPEPIEVTVTTYA